MNHIFEAVEIKCGVAIVVDSVSNARLDLISYRGSECAVVDPEPMRTQQSSGDHTNDLSEKRIPLTERVFLCIARAAA